MSPRQKSCLVYIETDGRECCSEGHSLPAERDIVTFSQHQSPAEVRVAYVGEIIVEIVKGRIAESPSQFHPIKKAK